MHGTTVADNTLIEGNGARHRASSPREGFRDELELRRGYKEDIWDVRLPPPRPIVPRRRRLGVPERIRFDGSVHTPLDEAAARRALQRLRKLGVESLAISTLFSFVNPAHERRLAELAREELPGRAALALARGDAEGARVRAHQHHGGERVRRPARDRLPRSADRAPARRRLREAAARRHLERRRDDARLPLAQPGADPRLGPGRRRDRRRGPRPRQGRAGPPVRGHGRHQLRRLGGPARPGARPSPAGTGTTAT